jgi:L-threonylcarbamoyladenylate synthase
MVYRAAMRVLKADDAAIAEAGAALRRGEVVAIPTETVYGLGADARNAAAVAAVFASKGRPSFDPLIVHVAREADAWAFVAGGVAAVPAAVRAVCARFWPGPLTAVLPRVPESAGGVVDLATSGLPTVGLRVPAHPVARAVIETMGAATNTVPGVAAPSANPFGGVSPTRAEHVTVPCALVLDGGPCATGVESTVVRATGDGRGLVVLRLGGVPVEALEATLREAGLDGGVTVAKPGEAVASPGMLERHYAPGARVVVVERGEAMEIALERGVMRGLLAYADVDDATRAAFDAVAVLSRVGDEREAAANLFAALRSLDGAGVGVIVAERAPERGLGRAINDRLGRAAAR